MELFHQIYKIHKLDKYLFLDTKNPEPFDSGQTLKLLKLKNAQGYDEGLVFSWFYNLDLSSLRTDFRSSYTSFSCIVRKCLLLSNTESSASISRSTQIMAHWITSTLSTAQLLTVSALVNLSTSSSAFCLCVIFGNGLFYKFSSFWVT